MAEFTALLITAAVVRVATPQTAALAPHQPQLGLAQPPYQPVAQGRATPQPGRAQPGLAFQLRLTVGLQLRFT